MALYINCITFMSEHFQKLYELSFFNRGFLTVVCSPQMIVQKKRKHITLVSGAASYKYLQKLF